jgi:DNA-binding protein YbaB
MDLGKLTQALAMMRRMGGAIPEIAGVVDGVNSRLATHVVEGVAGGGLVKVTMNGAMKCMSVHIDSSVSGKRTVLEDLTRTAVNDAMRQALEHQEKEQMQMSQQLMKSLPDMLRALKTMAGSAGGHPSGATGSGNMR